MKDLRFLWGWKVRFKVARIQRILCTNFIAIYRTSIMICANTRSNALSFPNAFACTRNARGLTTAERRIFRLARILESEGAVGTRLCRWDKLTTGPRRWDTTWIIRPSTHNCVALSGRAGSFESWYLQRARFRHNRAEIRKKRRATIAFAISRTDKTRYMYMLCSP